MPPDPSPQRPARDAEVTYRYLRIGLVVLVVLLAASVVLERLDANCWETSISAYYYTSARPVFVGALLAIGFGLIVLQGDTPIDDRLLNAAGLYAPVVALAPTTDVARCTFVPAPPQVTTRDADNRQIVVDWFAASVDNAIYSLVIVGAVAVVIAAAIAVSRGGGLGVLLMQGQDRLRLDLLWATIVIASVVLPLMFWERFHIRGHGFAAVGMFAALAIAAVVSGISRWQRGRKRYAVLYLVTGISMVAAFVITWAVVEQFDLVEWRHWVLWVENIEIGLFATYWLVQTVEHWDERVEPEPADSAATPPTPAVDA